jgi:hypothetical protein
VTEISQVLDKEPLSSESLNKVTSLYASLIEFESRLHFAEVTPQEQGIEMYKKAYKIMGIDELSDDLKYEVEKLHNFIDLQNNKENNESLTGIQMAVWLFSILGFVESFLKDYTTLNTTVKGVIEFFIFLILIIIFISRKYLKKEWVKLIAKIRRK